jgi:hypothetical protein
MEIIVKSKTQVQAQPKKTEAEIVNERRIRLDVMAKITTKDRQKVDILPVGPNKFRVNVWVQIGDGLFSERRIVETFYHVD